MQAPVIGTLTVDLSENLLVGTLPKSWAHLTAVTIAVWNFELAHKLFTDKPCGRYVNTGCFDFSTGQC